MKRRVVVVIAGINIGTAIKEDLDAFVKTF